MSHPSEITQLLADWNRGDQAALDKLLPLVYAELHRLAGSYMRRERPDHTLQATALVHEAYLRLVEQQQARPQTRGPFFPAAPQVMRPILGGPAPHPGPGHGSGRAAAVSVHPAAGLS